MFNKIFNWLFVKKELPLHDLETKGYKVVGERKVKN